MVHCAADFLNDGLCYFFVGVDAYRCQIAVDAVLLLCVILLYIYRAIIFLSAKLLKCFEIRLMLPEERVRSGLPIVCRGTFAWNIRYGA